MTEWDAIKDIFNLRARSVLSRDMRFIILIFMNYQFKNHLRSGHQKPFKKGHIVPVVICDLSWFDLVLWAGKCQVGLKSVTSFSVLRQRGQGCFGQFVAVEHIVADAARPAISATRFCKNFAFGFTSSVLR